MQNYLKGKQTEREQNVRNLIQANLHKVKELNALILQDYLDASHMKKMIQGFWIHAIKEVVCFEKLTSLVHKIRVKRFREYMFMKKIKILQQNARQKLVLDEKFKCLTELIVKNSLNLHI